jgi:hypothetical protein
MGTGFYPAGKSADVSSWPLNIYEGISKIFRTDAVQIKIITKRAWKLPTSNHLRATWHTDSLDMVVLPSIGATRYYNCCIDGGTSPEYFRYHLVVPRLSMSGAIPLHPKYAFMAWTGTILSFTWLLPCFSYSPFRALQFSDYQFNSRTKPDLPAGVWPSITSRQHMT